MVILFKDLGAEVLYTKYLNTTLTNKLFKTCFKLVKNIF